MVYKFFFYINDNLYFQANVRCSQCEGTAKNKNRCRRRVCIGTPYCFQHLASIKKLKIKESTIRNSGKGLFAWDPKNNGIVFKRPKSTRLNNTPGQKIVEYSGELIDINELNRRYQQYTAPYSVEINNDMYEDGSIIRGTGSLANHANARNSNARLEVSRNRIILRATKNIRHNQEILVNYGRSYRFNENTEHKTKYVS